MQRLLSGAPAEEAPRETASPSDCDGPVEEACATAAGAVACVATEMVHGDREVVSDDFEEWLGAMASPCVTREAEGGMPVRSEAEGAASAADAPPAGDFEEWVHSTEAAATDQSYTGGAPGGEEEVVDDASEILTAQYGDAPHDSLRISDDTITSMHIFKPDRKSGRRASTGPGLPVAADSISSADIHTHDVRVDKKTGRRVSVLNEELTNRVVEGGGLWEADDEGDDSEEEDDEASTKRISSFNAATARSSTLRLVFQEVEGGEGGSSDEEVGEKIAGGDALLGKTQTGDGGEGGVSAPSDQHNVVSSVFGFLTRRRSSV